MKLWTYQNMSFGRLTTVEIVPSSGHSVKWLCNCSCGKTSIVDQYALHSGHTKSCGCLRTEKNAVRHIKHGKSGNGGKRSRAYSSWSNMKNRCLNEDSQDWNYYGGRGIKICQRWIDSFEAFLADMGEPEAGLTIDREDVNGNYEPNNCRWSTRQVQSQNRRPREQQAAT